MCDAGQRSAVAPAHSAACSPLSCCVLLARLIMFFAPFVFPCHPAVEFSTVTRDKDGKVSFHVFTKVRSGPVCLVFRLLPAARAYESLANCLAVFVAVSERCRPFGRRPCSPLLCLQLLPMCAHPPLTFMFVTLLTQSEIEGLLKESEAMLAVSQ